MTQNAEQGWLTRERARTLAFIALTAAVAYLCWLLAAPLASAIAWALAMAVVAWPLHSRLVRRLKYRTLAAAFATLAMMIVLVVPAALAASQVAREAVGAATRIQASIKDGHWRELLDQNPRVEAALRGVDGVVDLRDQLTRLSARVPEVVQRIMAESLDFAIGTGVALFLLFFFLRDREAILAALRRLLPLSAPESNRVFRLVDDTIYAILYGTLAVCLVQGALGALAFWYLGLHAPLLWGSAMALMSIVPVIGTAIVWGPAAAYLLLQGESEKAMMLAAWGFLVIGLIDNLVKPAIVRDRLHAHIVPVFVAILGGLYAFGAAGVIIGPVVLSVALALLEIWRARLQTGAP